MVTSSTGLKEEERESREVGRKKEKVQKWVKAGAELPEQ